MRRKDKEIKEREIIDKIIRKCQVCRLGLDKDNIPYIVPVSFGYDGQNIYFHTAAEGKKIEYLSQNSDLCFEFEYDVRVIPHESSPCAWGVSFQSVIGYGNAREITGREGKTQGLRYIMQQYSQKEWTFSDSMLQNVRVWKIEVVSISGKQSNDRR